MLQFTKYLLKIIVYFRQNNDNNIIADVSQDSRKKKWKATANAVPKESNLSEGRSKIATSVMLISQRHYCIEHQKSCYVNGSNHLHLTPQHLSTWAAAIVSFVIRVTFRITFRVTVTHNIVCIMHNNLLIIIYVFLGTCISNN